MKFPEIQIPATEAKLRQAQLDFGAHFQLTHCAFSRNALASSRNRLQVLSSRRADSQNRIRVFYAMGGCRSKLILLNRMKPAWNPPRSKSKFIHQSRTHQKVFAALREALNTFAFGVVVENYVQMVMTALIPFPAARFRLVVQVCVRCDSLHETIRVRKWRETNANSSFEPNRLLSTRKAFVELFDRHNNQRTEIIGNK